MKRLLILAVAATALTACTKESKTEVEPSNPDPENLVTDPVFSVKQDVTNVVNPGQQITFTISTNIDVDDWVCTTTPENALIQVKKDSAKLVLAVSDDLDMMEDRKIAVEFSCPRYPDCGAGSSVVIKKALLLDVGFNADCTATDLSSNTYMITDYQGNNLVTYMNADAGRNVARFFHEIGSEVTDGYYKISYASNSQIKKAMADGHSFEVQFMLATENSCDSEVRMFSATQNGGTGIVLTNRTKGKDIAFIPNVSRTAASHWCYAQSGVVPEVGKYYHVVGVWNQEEGKAYVYVNGELMGQASANGSMIFPPSSTDRWIGIGADAASEGAEAAWNGDVVIARVYDAALSAAAVKKLWQEADKDFKTPEVLISDLLYFPEGKVNIGSKVAVCGEGFEAGDQVWLKSIESEDVTFACETEFKSTKLVYFIPSDFRSGQYKLFVKRGSEEAPLGLVSFTLTDTPVSWQMPKLIAHRGAWTATIPQNSLASLARAQELGCYASEMDLWITTDSVLYVNHDGKIGGKTIQYSTSAEMETVHLSNGEKIPTFQEYLEQLKKSDVTKLSIEIKDHNDQEREYLCVDEAVRILRENGLTGQVEWNSFDWNSCLRIIADEPQAEVYYQMPNTSLSLKTMRDVGFLGADYDYPDLFDNPELIDKAHALGMFVVAGGVHTVPNFVHCLGLGADQFSTNIPDQLIEAAHRLLD